MLLQSSNFRIPLSTSVDEAWQASSISPPFQNSSIGLKLYNNQLMHNACMTEGKPQQKNEGTRCICSSIFFFITMAHQATSYCSPTLFLLARM